MLQSAKLAQDPRVAEAKKTLLAVLHEHSATLTGPRPPDPALAAEMEKHLEDANHARGRAMYFPYLGSGLGNGALVELIDGSVKLDFISGIGVHVLGHSHPLIVEAGLDAALTDTVMQGNLQMNADAIQVCQILLNLANKSGARMGHCFLSTSGAMANENALKIIFQKRTPAGRILAFKGAFAGRSMTTAMITDRPEYRKGLPVTIQVDHVPFFDPNQPEQSTRQTLEAIDAKLAAHPGEHAAMIIEPIQGEGGFYPGSATYFEQVLARLREAGVLIFLDEIQSFGRTSQPFAFQHFGLDRFVDVVTIGKMTQVCATLYRAELNPDPALLSQTFTGSTSSIRAALAILNELQSGGYFGAEGKIIRLGAYFAEKLEALSQRFPDKVAGPYGLGGMVGFTPMGGDMAKTTELVKKLFANGLIGFPAGKSPARIRFLLPYGAIDEEDIDLACQIIEQTLETLP